MISNLTAPPKEDANSNLLHQKFSTDSCKNKNSTGPRYIPKSLSNSGIPKTISIAASKSFLLNGNLDFNLLDMSVDDGDTTPLDEGTRTMRFMSAASNLVEHFSSPSTINLDAFGNQSPPSSAVEPLSGCELDGRDKQRSKLEGKGTITEVTFPGIEIEPLTPTMVSPGKSPTNPATLKFLVPLKDGTFFTSGSVEGGRNWAFNSTLKETNSADASGHHDESKTLHLFATDVTVSGDVSKEQGTATRNETVPEYSIDEITPNLSPVTPLRTRQPQVKTETLPAVEMSSVQCDHLNSDQKEVEKKRATLQDVPFLKRFASRGCEESESPREGDGKSSRFKKMSLLKRWSSHQVEKGETSLNASGDGLGKEPDVDRGNEKGSILDKLAILKKLSSPDREGPGEEGAEEEDGGKTDGKESIIGKIPGLRGLSSRDFGRSADDDGTSPSMISKIPFVEKMYSRRKNDEPASPESNHKIASPSNPVMHDKGKAEGGEMSGVSETLRNTQDVSSEESENVRHQVLKRQVVNFLYRFVD